MRVVEHHRVEHVAGGRVEAEGDVGEAQDDLQLRELGADRPRSPPASTRPSLRSSSLPVQIVKVSGSISRSELRQAEAAAGEVDQAARDPSLSLARTWPCRPRRWSARSPPAPNLRASVMRAVGGASPSSKLIELSTRLAAVELERGLEHRQLGRIDHQRAVDLAAHAARRPRSSRPPRRGRRRRCRRRARCCPRATCSRPMATQPSQSPAACSSRNFFEPLALQRSPIDRIGVLLAQRHGREQRGERRACAAAARGLRTRPVAVLGQAAEHRIERRDVLGRGAAAAADDVDPVLGDEALEPARRARRAPADSGYGRSAARAGRHWAGTRSGRARSAARWRTMLGHLLGAGGAVEAHDRHAQRVDDGGGGRDVGADQHGAGGLDGDLDHQRQLAAAADEGVPAAVDRGLDLQRVLAGLDQQRRRRRPRSGPRPGRRTPASSSR